MGRLSCCRREELLLVSALKEFTEVLAFALILWHYSDIREQEEKTEKAPGL